MARAVVEARARIEARDGKITDKLLRAAGITTETSWPQIFFTRCQL